MKTMIKPSWICYSIYFLGAGLAGAALLSAGFAPCIEKRHWSAGDDARRIVLGMTLVTSSENAAPDDLRHPQWSTGFKTDHWFRHTSTQTLFTQRFRLFLFDRFNEVLLKLDVAKYPSSWHSGRPCPLTYQIVAGKARRTAAAGFAGAASFLGAAAGAPPCKLCAVVICFAHRAT
jgi:hypothetical protein